ncbi:MAG TPA: ParB N-terminal domain-containing protein [Termitinemataceae bacterium]|jgi:ParB family chromosome partitioning protein|uniref:ParB N-terminal domain-containing protein n=1 Tax=Treponema sp. J25 TaxID=2094121 RepID=UPI0010463001|nr:ParB N-terminal domain-containing protein [Treponema sp. J25]TCW60382.1 chromosome partitioning protein ParB [Treponema sp. J25]HOJ98760.1 ParB N-terminal domain-containing protein [Termitinemataceae bacterium]HOM23064.1 ParB N-terminal domain-containing protein [Termitinemataceae bacterium]HPP99914.1 ParB N-terminal domain-containing protein [Termitinemataceae bacterium]
MQVPIDAIIVKKRVRKDLGDLSSLMDSMRRYGLLHPILINKKNVLIAGHRRLEAAKQLGWRTINALIVDAQDELTKLELELEENINRKAFTEEELDKGLERLRKLRNPGIFRRIWNAIVNFFKRLFNHGDIY